MRKVVFVGSWKAHKTRTEAEAYFKELPSVSPAFQHEVILCPGYVHMQMAGDMLPSNVQLGAQDVGESGNFTGEISAAMLASYKVKYCIVGHIERRKKGETDAVINSKIKSLLAAGISPILCIGDTLQEYDANQTRTALEKQLRDCLMGVSDLSKVILCYMPIWSIGTGFYASGEYASMIADFMRKTVQKVTGNPMSGNVTILFGGQITSTNIREYLETPGIDGVMFAVAALNVRTFGEIVTTNFKPGKV